MDYKLHSSLRPLKVRTLTLLSKGKLLLSEWHRRVKNSISKHCFTLSATFQEWVVYFIVKLTNLKHSHEFFTMAQKKGIRLLL